jgi:hypothetical protein
VYLDFYLDHPTSDGYMEYGTKRTKLQLGSLPYISLGPNLGLVLLTLLSINTWAFNPKWLLVQSSPLSSTKLLPCDPYMRRAVSYDLVADRTDPG